MSTSHSAPLRAAEFFAGIGLVRMALERAGVSVVFANDIDATKARLYAENFGTEDLVVRDVRLVHADDVPDVDIATASFPCTDLSLAGNRAGLGGSESGTFWEFARVIDELTARRPPVILLENVAGLGSSRGGDDLRAAIERLNGLGYICDIVCLDARRWVPQSRPRVFVVGSMSRVADADAWGPSELRPPWIGRFRQRYTDLNLQAVAITPPDAHVQTLATVVERLPSTDDRWWDADRVARFMGQLSPTQRARLDALRRANRHTWRTAYRRTRSGRPAWEIRADEISGCLRTARGGSSKQALVEVAMADVRVRWMTPTEYARLMGAPEYRLDVVTPNQALFGLGDAVCVPAVSWLVTEYVAPLAERQKQRKTELAFASSR